MVDVYVTMNLSIKRLKYHIHIYTHTVVAKRTLELSSWYGLLTGLIGAATSYMALLAGK
jgi:hypothetical protein